MNTEFLFALYVFCADYHSGQWSRGYRIMSRLNGDHYRIKITDNCFKEMRESPYYLELESKYSDKI